MASRPKSAPDDGANNAPNDPAPSPNNGADDKNNGADDHPTAPEGAGPRSKQAADDRALVIGINNYAAPNQLPSCIADADAFGNLIKDQYGIADIRTLRDAEATKDDIRAGLRWLFGNARPDSRLVLFFSGHGFRPSSNGNIEDAIVCQDSQFFTTTELAEEMNDLPQGVLTIVLDACFSGAMEKLFVNQLGQVEVGKTKRWVLSSAQDVDLHRSSFGKAITFKPFGASEPVIASTLEGQLRATPSGKDFVTPVQIVPLTDRASKGLLLSACLEDEEASASTSQTAGLSAFTYCFVSSARKLGPGRTTENVMTLAGSQLSQLGFKQTPMLKEPIVPPGLARLPFLRSESSAGTTGRDQGTIDPRTGEGDPTKGQQRTQPSSDEIAQIIRRALEISKFNGEDNMNQQQTFGFGRPNDGFMSMQQGPLGADQKGGLDDVTRVTAQVIPAVMAALGKGYQTGAGASASPQGFGQQQGYDKGWFDDVTRVVAQIVPVVISALGKGYQPGAGASASPQGFGQQQGYDKGWFDDVTRVVSQIVPVVISALGKGYQPGAGASASPQGFGQQGQGYDKGWFDDVTRVVAQIVPVVISALGKGYQPGAGASASPQGFGQQQQGYDKGWFDDVTRIVAQVVPVVISALGKGYQPGAGASASPQGFGQQQGYDKGWFDDVTRIVAQVVPVVISALGKGYQPGSASSQPMPSSFVPSASMGPASMGPENVDQKNWLSSIISIAVPLVISAL